METIYVMMLVALVIINLAVSLKLRFLEEKMVRLETSFQSVSQDFQEILNEIMDSVYAADAKMSHIIAKCEAISKKMDDSVCDPKEFPAPIIPIKPNNWDSMKKAFSGAQKTEIDERN